MKEIHRSAFRRAHGEVPERSTERLYLIYKFASNTVFYVPILILYFQRRVTDPTWTFHLIAVYTASIAILEIPTGVIADALGQRRTLIAGLLCSLAGAVIFMLSSSGWGLLLGQVVVALALSLRSGTDSAYLYELSRRPDVYERLEGRATSVNYIALGASSILGSLLLEQDEWLPFLATGLFTVVAGIALATIPRVAASNNARPRLSTTEVLRTATAALRTQRMLMLVILYVAAVMTVSGLSYWSCQLYLEHIHFPLRWFGTAYAAYFLSSSLGAAYALRLNRSLGYRRALLLVTATLIACVLLMGAVRHPAGVALLVGTNFVTGYFTPTLRALLQGFVESNIRATLLSVESMLYRLMFAGLAFAFGYVVSSRGLPSAYLALGAASLAVFPLVTLRLTARLAADRPDAPVPATTAPRGRDL